MRIHKILLIVTVIVMFLIQINNVGSSLIDFIGRVRYIYPRIDLYGFLAFITSFLNILTLFLSSIGLFLFVKNSRIINKFLIGFIIVENFKTISTLVAMLRFPKQYFPNINEVGFYYYFGIAMMVLVLVFSVNYFVRVQNLQNEYDLSGLIVINKSRLVRLVNYIIDHLLIAGTSFNAFYILNKTIDLKFVFLLHFLIYYTFSEFLFGRTLGKSFTNTLIIKSNNFLFKIFVRTLIRLIPFEQLSFLSTKKSGWHDRISGTYLYTWEKT